MDKAKKTILLVDDDLINIHILREALKENYIILAAKCGISALEIVKNTTPDLILLDVVMPGMDGFEVCSLLKKDDSTKEIPIIFITSLSDVIDEEKGLLLGAIDYITKPFNSYVLKLRINNHLKLKQYSDKLEETVKIRTDELEQIKEIMITTMAMLIECHDYDTGKHIHRTRHYMRCLAEELVEKYPNELSEKNIDLLCQSAMLHDIGKIGIKDSILKKRGKLTKSEFEKIKQHTIIGSDILKKVEALFGSNSFLNIARIITEFHHEKFDGSGYPYGLKGEEIPLFARMMAVIDVYDALVSKRSYKEVLKYDEVIKKIYIGDERTSPNHFDPNVLSAFKKSYPKIMEITNKYSFS
jgi:putative two-component system response regulator